MTIRQTVTRYFFFAYAFKHGSATFDAFAADQKWFALVRHAPVTEPKYKVSSARLCVVNVCATNMYRERTHALFYVLNSGLTMIKVQSVRRYHNTAWANLMTPPSSM